MKKLNHWKLFLTKNSHIDIISEISGDFQDYTDVPDKDYDNIFFFDGTVPIVVERVLDVLMSKKEQIFFLDEINKNGTTIFGWHGEGDCSDHTFDAAHKLINLLELDIEKFYFINCVKQTLEIYEDYAKKYNIRHKIKNFLFSSVWQVSNEYYNIPDGLLETSADNKKLFISPNLTPKRHRFALISLLNYYDLLDEGYVSSVSIECKDFKYDQNTDFNNHLYWTEVLFSKDTEFQKIIEKSHQLKNKLPLRIDRRTSFDVDAGQVWSHPSYKLEFYKACCDSLFYLITENQYGQRAFNFTEKIFIPISLGKPFLVIGSLNFLKELKKMGYQTFHSYIDESYDSISDLSLRIKTVVLELNRLNVLRKTNPSTFYSDYEKMKEIADHNQKIFNNTK